ncbi:hypothetical protein DH86_00003747, partial [Scytalidium sp. 3C]
MEETSHQQTWLVVGASRGIGLELCRQLVSKGHRVIGTVRNSEAPWALGKSDPRFARKLDFIKHFVGLDEHRIDYVVINAGILQYP